MTQVKSSAGGRMPQVKMEWTLGNVLNFLATLATLIGMIIAVTASYNGLQKDIAILDYKVKQLEGHEQTRKADHDLLVEIRRDLQLLRDSLTGRRSALEP